MVGMPGGTRRSTSPTKPRWRKALTRNRPSPAIAYVKLASWSTQELVCTARRHDRRGDALGVGRLDRLERRLAQPPSTRRHGRAPTLTCMSDAPCSTAKRRNRSRSSTLPPSRYRPIGAAAWFLRPRCLWRPVPGPATVAGTDARRPPIRSRFASCSGPPATSAAVPSSPRRQPEPRIVGRYAWGADKVAGRDVGELCGIAPLGILATDDVDALLALEPDCVVYNPKWPDVDEMVRILEAGVNIVSTAAFITGTRSVTVDRRRGRVRPRWSSAFGSGINPGFIDALAIFTAGICDRVDSISVLESADSTGYDSPETELPVGFARTIDDPTLPEHGA